MDAGLVIPRLIEKLDEIIQDTMFKEQVQIVIHHLRLLEKILKDKEDDGWISRLLQAVYLAEDAADTFLLRKIFKKYSTMSIRSQTVLFMKMKKFGNDVKSLIPHDQLSRFTAALCIEKNESDCDILINGDARRNHENDGDQFSNNLQRSEKLSGCGLEEEADVAVGRDALIKDLVSKLVSESDDSQQGVITLVGEAGCGKTALARNVYNSNAVKRHFTKRAWVQVPGLFFPRDVVADIFVQVKEDQNWVEAPLSKEELIQSLKSLMKKTRCLIVIEDVETPEMWEALALESCSSPGSKIMITSRNKQDVMTSKAAAHSHSLIHVTKLNNEESWKLFLQTVQTSDDELEKLKSQILEICDRLPLNIVLLGGLLLSKSSSYEKFSSVIQVVKDAYRGDISGVCYQDLCWNLKPCFLFMGIFPRAFEIPVRRLIHLWYAEGFIDTSSRSGCESAEDVAEMYLEELVIRNMVEIVRWSSDGSHPKTCRMPNLLYDIFSLKVKETGFFHNQFQASPNQLEFTVERFSLTPKDTKLFQMSCKQPKFAVRRFGTYFGIKNRVPSSFAHLRSYLAFDIRMLGTPAEEMGTYFDKIRTANSHFILLTVLDLEGVYKPKLTNVLSKMTNLRYLGLRSTFLEALPHAVRDLPCLETLDVKKTNIKMDFSFLEKLRHFYGGWGSIKGLSHVDIEIKLHTLSGFILTSKDDDETAGAIFAKMTELKRLGLKSESRNALISIITYGISQLTKLQSLKLTSRHFKEDPGDLPFPNLEKHKELRKLYLQGELQPVTNFNRLPTNLQILTLSQSHLEDDPMPLLGKLPQLSVLRLFADSFVGEEMKCLSREFPKLLVLKLWKLHTLEKWTVEKGSMPCLREIEIRSCLSLNQPEGLQHLTSLKELVLTDMNSGFGSAIDLGSNVCVYQN